MDPRWKQFTEYELLEVRENATAEEIKRAWEIQRIAWHPDKFPSTFATEVTDRFSEIKQAFETLANPVLRKRLDLSLGVEGESGAGAAKPAQFELPEQRVPENWKHLSHWAKEEDKLKAASRGFAYKVADQYLEKGRALSDPQLDWAKKIWKEAIEAGFDPGEEE